MGRENCENLDLAKISCYTVYGNSEGIVESKKMNNIVMGEIGAQDFWQSWRYLAVKLASCHLPGDELVTYGSLACEVSNNNQLWLGLD